MAEAVARHLESSPVGIIDRLAEAVARRLGASAAVPVAADRLATAETDGGRVESTTLHPNARIDGFVEQRKTDAVLDDLTDDEIVAIASRYVALTDQVPREELSIEKIEI